MNYSPLRYPGGKTKMLPIIKSMIEKLENCRTYIEPFAGGAGVALGLLFDNCVDNIVINDFDKSIYSIWRAILTETDKLIQLINNTPISITEWYKQKEIYTNNNKKYSLIGYINIFTNKHLLYNCIILLSLHNFYTQSSLIHAILVLILVYVHVYVLNLVYVLFLV